MRYVLLLHRGKKLSGGTNPSHPAESQQTYLPSGSLLYQQRKGKLSAAPVPHTPVHRTACQRAMRTSNFTRKMTAKLIEHTLQD